MVNKRVVEYSILLKNCPFRVRIIYKMCSKLGKLGKKQYLCAQF
jgi:hypothetical protein